eukprot:3507572-Rhodomonas_salina.1
MPAFRFENVMCRLRLRPAVFLPPSSSSLSSSSSTICASSVGGKFAGSCRGGMKAPSPRACPAIPFIGPFFASATAPLRAAAFFSAAVNLRPFMLAIGAEPWLLGALIARDQFIGFDTNPPRWTEATCSQPRCHVPELARSR